jgi:L-rhamnose isomerase/sugar isomerase
MYSYPEDEIAERYNFLGRDLARKGIDIEEVKIKVSNFTVEVPSWVFGPFGGGRFSSYIPPGAARNVFEKFDDAALVHRLTGATPKVSIHIGWDCPENVPFERIEAEHFGRLKDYAENLGLGIGSVNPTYFLEGTHFGSLSADDVNVRRKLIEHTLVAAEVARKYGDGIIVLWFPDGSLYPGQVNFRLKESNLRRSLREIYDRAPSSVKMLIEYKLFEPGTYHTVIPDPFTAYDLARSLGDRAGVIIDLGHHAFGVNVEHIAARLIESGIPAGIHFNSRYVADDDQAVEPNMQMFLLFHELTTGNVIGNPDPDKNWVYIIDQCSKLENRIHAVLHTIDSLMISYAKALIVDEEKLREYQTKNEIILANRTLLDAFLTDVRPIIYAARLERGLPPDPVKAYLESSYQRKIEMERS